MSTHTSPGPQLQILMMGYVWPEPTSSAAGVRDLDLIRIFKSLNYKITYASPSKLNSFTEQLNQLGVATRSTPANDSAFDEWIAGERPDVVIFDRFVMEEQFGARVKDHSPETLRILDTQDLHFLRRAREQALAEGKSLDEIKRLEIPLVTEDCLRELAAILRSDLTLVLSEFEYRLLTERFRIDPRILHHLPIGYEPLPPDTLPSYEARKNFVFIGNFRHPPNADAVRWIAGEIWPQIRQEIPDAELHVYGAYPPREMMELDSPATGFRIRGHASDQYEILKKYRVSLCALRYGAGIKGKISDSWRVGTPVVTTPIGAEGMPGFETSGEVKAGGYLASDPEALASAATRLYRDPILWHSLQSSGFHLIQESLSTQKLGSAFDIKLLKIYGNIPAHRDQNWLGAMLWQHAYRSTTYFSRWIEAKNRLLRQD